MFVMHSLITIARAQVLQFGMILLQVVSSASCAVYAEKSMIEFARRCAHLHHQQCLNVGDGGEHIARAPQDPPVFLFVYACYARLLRR